MIGFLVNRRHNRLRTLLSAYIDRQVSEVEVSQVEEHLAGCGECRLELDTLRATVGLLKNLPELEVPRSFTLTESPAPISPTPSIAWAPRIATSAVALLLVVLLVGDALGVITQSAPSGEIAAPLEFRAPAPEAAAPAAAAPAPEAAAPAAAAPAPEAAAPAATAPAPEAAAPAAAAAAAPAPTPPPAPVAAMAAPAPPADAAVEERAVAVTPEQEPEVERQAAAEKAISAPAAQTPEISDEGAPEAVKEPGGLELPVWQLEIAAGALVAVLALATFLLARRSRRPIPR